MTARTESISKPREERRENDQYESPIKLCSAVCTLLAALNPKRILEPGAGGGNFVAAARKTWPDSFIVGVEIMPKIVSVADREAVLVLRKKWKKDLEYWKWERDAKGVVRPKPKEPLAPEPSDDTVTRLTTAGSSSVVIADYLGEQFKSDGSGWKNEILFDLIVGNPPYSLVEAFIERSVEMLAPGGVLAFVLKMHVFGTKKRAALWKKFPFYVAFPIDPRPDFTGEGRDTSEYALVTWKKTKDGALLNNKTLLVDQPLEWSVS